MNFIKKPARYIYRYGKYVYAQIKNHNSISYEMSKEWQLAQESLKNADYVIDLGCGGNPHPNASVGVDAFLQPVHRNLGRGQVLTEDYFNERGIRFVHASLEDLPFRDKEFDFAYSHHAIEHVQDPKKACAEMCRIAKAGVIICPSIFAELAFGRPYHLWFVIARGNTLVFIKKAKFEDRPFGETPKLQKDGSYLVFPESNPFDTLLSFGNWYKGKERMPRLSKLIQIYWHSHSPVMEVVFNWKDGFECIVVEEDGSVR